MYTRMTPTLGGPSEVHSCKNGSLLETQMDLQKSDFRIFFSLLSLSCLFWLIFRFSTPKKVRDTIQDACFTYYTKETLLEACYGRIVASSTSSREYTRTWTPKIDEKWTTFESKNGPFSGTFFKKLFGYSWRSFCDLFKSGLNLS